MRNVYNISVRILKGRDHLGSRRVDGRILLKLCFGFHKRHGILLSAWISALKKASVLSDE
jgi:hypothetical protein